MWAEHQRYWHSCELDSAYFMKGFVFSKGADKHANKGIVEHEGISHPRYSNSDTSWKVKTVRRRCCEYLRFVTEGHTSDSLLCLEIILDPEGRWDF